MSVVSTLVKIIKDCKCVWVFGCRGILHSFRSTDLKVSSEGFSVKCDKESEVKSVNAIYPTYKDDLMNAECLGLGKGYGI